MSHRIAATPGVVATATRIACTSWRVPRILVAGLLFAASAANGQSGPPTQPKPKAAAPSIAKQSGGAAPATNAAAPAPGAGVPRALREAMAEVLEGSVGFRSSLEPAPRLHDAKLVGPLQASTGLFHSSFETIYCASARVDFWPLPGEPVAMLKIVTDENGKQRIVGSVGLTGGPMQCRGIKNYGPFPELEAARERRRQALGKTD
jgi:hypothetical protein